MSLLPARGVLADAYRCFCRYGLRRTTVGDIATEAGLSRPTVYKHLGSKEQAFELVAEAILTGALERARQAAGGDVLVSDRVAAVLGVKLDVAAQLHHDSPAHAHEFLGADSSAVAGHVHRYIDALKELLTHLLDDELPRAPELAEILLTFTRGLEDDLPDPTAPARLRTATNVIIQGGRTLADPTEAPSRPAKD